jgi:hypothetical protein
VSCAPSPQVYNQEALSKNVDMLFDMAIDVSPTLTPFAFTRLHHTPHT